MKRRCKSDYSCIMPKARMDGIVFTKQVYPIKKKDMNLKTELNVNVIVMNSYREILIKLNNK